ncbi:holin [Rugamonas aquatica]|uniref:holin n=1 Tax=Rugamonas aquatica TaxID=2743357 RepID=UPI001F1F2A61|nr:holin [Rugamonas aquatica]
MPGAAGAALSLKFLGGELGVGQKITSFAVGFVCACYLAPAAIDLFSIQGGRVHAGIQFLVGLFALATCRELFVEINSADLIGSLKRRFLGDRT